MVDLPNDPSTQRTLVGFRSECLHLCSSCFPPTAVFSQMQRIPKLEHVQIRAACAVATSVHVRLQQLLLTCLHSGYAPTWQRASFCWLQMNALDAPKVIVASVCHGPAAFTTVKRPSDGEWMVKGKKVWCACDTNRSVPNACWWDAHSMTSATGRCCRVTREHATDKYSYKKRLQQLKWVVTWCRLPHSATGESCPSDSATMSALVLTAICKSILI